MINGSLSVVPKCGKRQTDRQTMDMYESVKLLSLQEVISLNNSGQDVHTYMPV